MDLVGVYSLGVLRSDKPGGRWVCACDQLEEQGESLQVSTPFLENMLFSLFSLFVLLTRFSELASNSEPERGFAL